MRTVALVVTMVVMAGSCAGGDGGEEDGEVGGSTTTTVVTEAPSSTTAASATTVTTGAPTTTSDPDDVPSTGVLVTGPGGAALAREPGGAPYGRLREGVALSFDTREGPWVRVLTPCENAAWTPLADGRYVAPVEVVLDAGHGGDEPGAVGPGGLREKDLNLAVVERTVGALEAAGVSVALTRPHDYRVTIASRVAIAAALEPEAFVSVHHNAAPDGPRDSPGTETFYQISSAESKRLSGLIYEEMVKALDAFEADWVADTDAGAKYRPNDRGGDYYGILRRSAEAGVVSSLAELAFLSNPSEEALLQRDDVRQAEADALARALVRFLRTDDPGSGYSEPYPRTAPAGPGGGTTGCVDPT